MASLSEPDYERNDCRFHLRRDGFLGTGGRFTPTPETVKT